MNMNMNPQSRRKNPMRADDAQFLSPETFASRSTNGNAAQDETAKYNLLSHYTISRDETASGNSMEDKLHALRATISSKGDEQNGRHQITADEIAADRVLSDDSERVPIDNWGRSRQAAAPTWGFKEPQGRYQYYTADIIPGRKEIVGDTEIHVSGDLPLRDFDFDSFLSEPEVGKDNPAHPFNQRLFEPNPIAPSSISIKEGDGNPRKYGSELRALPIGSYDTKDADISIAYNSQNNTQERTLSQSDSLNLFLQQKVEALHNENERLRQQQEDKSIANFEVFHCISDQGQDDTYLEKPYWATAGKVLQLKANSPILYPDAYIQYKAPAFVVYRYYSTDEGIKSDKALHQNKVPDAKPTNEIIRLVSEDMVGAAKAFMKNHGTSQKRFPCLSVGKEMQAPYLWWYYYKDHPNVLSNLSRPQAELMQSLTGWIDGNYGGVYCRIDSQFERGMVSEASMSFLIRPGDIVVKMDEEYAEGHLSMSWLEKTPRNLESGGLSDDHKEFTESVAPSPLKSEHEWGVDSWSYSYDGSFYRIKRKLNIQLHVHTAYEETPIADLGVFPLRFASQELREALERRGKIFWSCRHRKYVSYANGTKDRDSAPGERYMIDYSTHQLLHPNSTDMSAQTRKFKVESAFIEKEAPSETDVYLLPRTLLGFDLRRKKWEDLNVDLIQEVSWNKQAFTHLVADPETKELVQALVTNKVAAERGTDLMQNKGNGLIMLLHGGPGTGKTFTAESVAEIAEKPLYPVTCGDIGTQPEHVEKYLESVFHLGKIWGCVVLLDEAEVFLEQRSLNDLARNALVSVFLRALEYYDGILILTSNRVGTFDEAFKSRIQLALHYEPLTQPRRARIWRNFFSRLKSLGEDNIDFDDVESYIGELSEREMNGRQIRNVITTARQWAQFQGKMMTASHLKYAIKVTGKFDIYIKDIKEGFSDEQIARGDGVR